MSEPFYFEDARTNVEEIKNHQFVIGYAIYRALRDNKNIPSLEDFNDFCFDIETKFKSDKDLHLY